MRSTSSADWLPIVTAADQVLADLDTFAVDVAAAIRAAVPEYVYVADEALQRTISRNLHHVLTCLRDERQLAAEEIKDLELTVEARARSGVPLDEYLHAILTADAALWTELLDRVRPAASAEVLFRAFTIRHTYINTITRATAVAHRRVELVVSQEHHERRALALRSLMRGGLSEQTRLEHASRLGLAPDSSYYVVAARGGPDADSDQVQRQLDPRQASALVLWGDDVVGLLLELPKAVRGISGGIAGPCTLQDLPDSYRQAGSALRTALALHLEGLYSGEDLGVRVAVQELPGIGRALRAKYLAPVLASGSLGQDLMATVEAYLMTGSRRDETAAQLHLHGNTVAYRIRRFTELTGADLTNVPTIVELWWLFMDLRLHGQL